VEEKRHSDSPGQVATATKQYLPDVASEKKLRLLLSLLHSPLHVTCITSAPPQPEAGVSGDQRIPAVEPRYFLRQLAIVALATGILPYDFVEELHVDTLIKLRHKLKYALT
jgi:hypothetical protein